MNERDLTRGTLYAYRPQPTPRRSWPWWILAVGAFLAGTLPSLIVGVLQ